MNVTTGTAGHYVRQVLDQAAIASREEGHINADCYWVAVDAPDGGQIWFSGSGEQENRVGYSPHEHCGWFVAHADPGGAVSVLYSSNSTNLVADTTAAVAAVRAALTGSAPE